MLLLSFLLLANLASPRPLNYYHEASDIQGRQDWFSDLTINEIVEQDIFPTFNFDFSIPSFPARIVLKPSPTAVKSDIISVASTHIAKPLHVYSSEDSQQRGQTTFHTIQKPSTTAWHPPLDRQSTAHIAAGTSRATSRVQQEHQHPMTRLLVLPEPTAVTQDPISNAGPRPNNHFQQGGPLQHDITMERDDTPNVLQGNHHEHQNGQSQQIHGAQQGGHEQENGRVQPDTHTQQGFQGILAGSRPTASVVPISLSGAYGQAITTYMPPPPPVIHQAIPATSTVHAADPVQSGQKGATYTRHNKAVVVACAMAILLAGLMASYLIVYLLSRQRQSNTTPPLASSPTLDRYDVQNLLKEKDDDDDDDAFTPHVSYTGLLLARDSRQLRSTSPTSTRSLRRARSLPAPGKDFNMGSRWSMSSSDLGSARRFSMENGRWRHIRGVLSFGSGLAQRASVLIRHSMVTDGGRSLNPSRKSSNVPLLSPQEFFALSDDEGDDDGDTSRRTAFSFSSQTTAELPYKNEDQP